MKNCFEEVTEGKMNKFSMIFKSKLLESLYQSKQNKVAKTKSLFLIRLQFVAIFWLFIIGAYSYMNGIEPEKHIWGMKIFVLMFILTFIELEFVRFNIRFLQGCIMILMTYVGMVEFSIRFYQSLLLTPISIPFLITNLYIGINISRNWITALLTHFTGLAFYVIRCFILTPDLPIEKLYIIPFGKIVMMFTMTMIIIGVIFNSEERERRENFNAQYFNAKKQKQLKNILLTMPIGVILIQDGIELFNKALLEIFGISPEIDPSQNSLITKIIRKISEIRSTEENNPRTLSEIVTTELGKAKAKGGRVGEGISSLGEESISEIMFFEQEKNTKVERKWIEAMFSSFEVNEEPTVLLMVKDQTPFKKLETKKIRHKFNNLLMTSMSHELRTPVHIISAMIQLIESRTTDKQILNYCKKADISGQLLTCLINGLLDYYQVQSKSFKIKYELVDIRTIIMKASELVREQIRSEVQFQFSPHPNLPTNLTIDSRNAAKYTFKGLIFISARFKISKQMLRCEIKDTGIGISAHLKDSVFEFFHDPSSANSSRVQHGIGMGLGIVKALTGALKGGVKVESEEGKGSIFSFNICATETEEEMQHYLKYPSLMSPKHSPSHMMASGSFGCLSDIHSSMSDIEQINIPLFVTKASKRDFGRLLLGDKEKLSTCPAFLSPQEPLILVVDDQSVNLFAVKALLKLCGLICEKASNGQEAIEKVLKAQRRKLGNYKLIFMDCNMPIMDGYQATRILTEKMENGEIEKFPILALTAYVSDLNMQECLNSGMSSVLSKPLTLKALKEALNIYFKQK